MKIGVMRNANTTEGNEEQKTGEKGCEARRRRERGGDKYYSAISRV